jgi:hypothetical protein
MCLSVITSARNVAAQPAASSPAVRRLSGRRSPSRSCCPRGVRCIIAAHGSRTRLTLQQGARDLCLAAADEVTRQRCMRIIEAASAGASPLQHIAWAAALTADLFAMRSVAAVNAVLVALGGTAVERLDLASIRALGCSAACFIAAGVDVHTLQAAGLTAADFKAAGCDARSVREVGYDAQSVVAAFGYDACAAAGCGFILVSRSAACASARCRNNSLLSLPSPASRQRDGINLYMTLHGHDVHGNAVVRDGELPVHVPAGWHIADGNADDARVCGTHLWQSYSLVFANGDAYGTALSSHTASIGAFTSGPCGDFNS